MECGCKVWLRNMGEGGAFGLDVIYCCLIVFLSSIVRYITSLSDASNKAFTFYRTSRPNVRIPLSNVRASPSSLDSFHLIKSSYPKFSHQVHQPTYENHSFLQNPDSNRLLLPKPSNIGFNDFSNSSCFEELWNESLSKLIVSLLE